MISSSNSFLSTRPTGRVLWKELLVLSRFHSISLVITSGRVEFLSPEEKKKEVNIHSRHLVFLQKKQA